MHMPMRWLTVWWGNRMKKLRKSTGKWWVNLFSKEKMWDSPSSRMKLKRLNRRKAETWELGQKFPKLLDRGKRLPAVTSGENLDHGTKAIEIEPFTNIGMILLEDDRTLISSSQHRGWQPFYYCIIAIVFVRPSPHPFYTLWGARLPPTVLQQIDLAIFIINVVK